ncbi:hypothetical protein [Lactobacillus sp.]|uniref:hypothetical protein n=1 Tax=Lactobacillus sp. TaxID=1591 RepID=UPI002590C14E|nr:hypothetical protein [Lactobacillus sp.]MCO6528960.1 hypothetical protein [Lactobacillus sp.]MCO6530559.1 hypothetical protein [Lactobacillus sp.]
MNLSDKIVTSFLLAGGLGYISYLILEMTGVISSEESNSSKVNILSLLFSLPNYFIYLLIQRKLRLGLILSLFFTILIITTYTYVVGKFAIKIMFHIINFEKTHTLNTGLDLGQPWTAIEKENVTLVYLYNLDHSLIACGFGKNFSSNGNSVNLYADKQFETGVSSYEDVFKCAYKKKETDKSKRDSNDAYGVPIEGYLCHNATVHINFKKGFIMIIFNVEEREDKETLDEHKTQ